MVSNYTATKSLEMMMTTLQVEKTTNDQIRATLVYTNLIRRYFKNTAPIVLGGIEAKFETTYTL